MSKTDSCPSVNSYCNFPRFFFRAAQPAARSGPAEPNSAYTPRMSLIRRRPRKGRPVQLREAGTAKKWLEGRYAQRPQVTQITLEMVTYPQSGEIPWQVFPLIPWIASRVRKSLRSGLVSRPDLDSLINIADWARSTRPDLGQFPTFSDAQTAATEWWDRRQRTALDDIEVWRNPQYLREWAESDYMPEEPQKPPHMPLRAEQRSKILHLAITETGRGRWKKSKTSWGFTDWTWREVPADSLDAYGNAMGNCLGDFVSEATWGMESYYVLHDPSGKPHVAASVAHMNWDAWANLNARYWDEIWSFEDDFIQLGLDPNAPEEWLHLQSLRGFRYLLISTGGDRELARRWLDRFWDWDRDWSEGLFIPPGPSALTKAVHTRRFSQIEGLHNDEVAVRYNEAIRLLVRYVKPTAQGAEGNLR